MEKYKIAILANDGLYYVQYEYDTLEQLLTILSYRQNGKADFSTGKIVYNNEYLDRINMNCNDTLFINNSFKPNSSYYIHRPYIFLYGNSIIDVRRYYKQIETLSENFVNTPFRTNFYRLPRKNKYENNARFRIDPVPGTSRCHGYSWYRNSKVGAIIREARNNEYKEFRRAGYWSEFDTILFEGNERSFSKSWKDNTKIRKQWEKNIPR